MSRRNALWLLTLLIVAAAPARADWLVTRDGGRVETKGPWKVKGKLVVFTQADGALSSLRLSEVDLDASRKATESARIQAEKPPAPAPPKKKLAVLTDADFKKATPQGSTAAAPPEAAPDAPAGLVSISSWKRADQGDGLAIEGTLHNNTDDMVVNAAVEVQLYNEAGDRVGTAPALLTTTSITPKGTVDFRASFPGVFAYSDVKFEAKGLPLDITPAAPPEQQPQ
ncbi:MAG TPA: FxLYD domain-containing protein [Thermoanaerobaculia bacterium]